MIETASSSQMKYWNQKECSLMASSGLGILPDSHLYFQREPGSLSLFSNLESLWNIKITLILRLFYYIMF